MFQSAQTILVYACCPSLIINGSPPFTLKSVLVWMVSMITLMIRQLRQKHLQCLAVLNRSPSSDVNGLLELLGDGKLHSACGGKEGHLEVAVAVAQQRRRTPGTGMQPTQMEDGEAPRSVGHHSTRPSPLFSQKTVDRARSNSENGQVHCLLLSNATGFTGLVGIEIENAWR